MNSQQFESTNTKLRAIIQSYLNSNNSWTANDFRNDTQESDPMEVDHISKGKVKSKGKDNGKCKGKRTGKRAKADQQDKECYLCGKRGHFVRDCWSRANQDRTVDDVEVVRVDSDAGRVCVCD